MNREELIDSLRERVAELEGELAGIKGQEPVAWVGAIKDCATLLVIEPQLWKAIPLYTSPPTKQSVVVPEREECDDDRNHPNSWTDYAIGWNACRRETKRLNGQSQ